MIRAMIVDDEYHAREELSHFLSEDHAIEIVASCSNSIDALKAINELKPNLLFLDIEMPQLNGFELLSVVNQEVMPHVVFVTAYDQYSLKAFEEKAIDYLLKPIDPERFTKTLIKVKKELQSPHSATTPDLLERIPCLRGKKIQVINLAEIEHVASKAQGVTVITTQGEYYTALTMKELEKRTNLRRCHRQYLINLEHVQEITLFEGGQAKITTRSGAIVPVSRRHLKPLKERLHL